MTIYLYKKTHNKTGLQYLGKTKLDPFKYKGSGKDWIPHIKEHGYDVTTEILKECSTNEELKEWGLHYSNLWDIVESDVWANRIPETGGGTLGGIDSPTATKLNNKRVAEGTHPFQRRPDGTSYAADRSKAGTHNWQGSASNNKRVAEGTHPLQRRPNGTSSTMDRVVDGTNPFLGPSINLARLAAGTHPSQKKIKCVRCGKESSIGMHKRWHGDNCKLKNCLG